MDVTVGLFRPCRLRSAVGLCRERGVNSGKKESRWKIKKEEKMKIRKDDKRNKSSENSLTSGSISGSLDLEAQFSCLILR